MPMPYAKDVMRTTIDIDDALLAELKRRAAEQGTTIGRLIQDYVRLAIAKCDPEITPREPFEVITAGGGQPRTWSEIKQILEEEDIERYKPRRD